MAELKVGMLAVPKVESSVARSVEQTACLSADRLVDKKVVTKDPRLAALSAA